MEEHPPKRSFHRNIARGTATTMPQKSARLIVCGGIVERHGAHRLQPLGFLPIDQGLFLVCILPHLVLGNETLDWISGKRLDLGSVFVQACLSAGTNLLFQFLYQHGRVLAQKQNPKSTNKQVALALTIHNKQLANNKYKQLIPDGRICRYCILTHLTRKHFVY